MTASDEVNLTFTGVRHRWCGNCLIFGTPWPLKTRFFKPLQPGRATLPKDWVSSEELELRPGEQLALKLSVEPHSRYIGVLAAYRDLPHVAMAGWVLPVAPGQLTRPKSCWTTRV